MMSVLIRLGLVFALLGGVMAVTGCNTMEGLGQDIQALGGAISGEADEHDDY